jgi:hypothetical protein
LNLLKTPREQPDPYSFEGRRRGSPSGWQSVYDFLFKLDDRSYLFVINQLRQKLGNRQTINKHLRRMTEDHRERVEERKQKFINVAH